jgi:phage-related protein
MVTTRSGKTTTTTAKITHKNSQQVLQNVLEEMLYEANERAHIFERQLDVMTDKCKMLEEELMNVRFKHVQEIKKFERESKNRSFYFTFWLICSLWLNCTYVYYAMPMFE